MKGGQHRPLSRLMQVVLMKPRSANSSLCSEPVVPMSNVRPRTVHYMPDVCDGKVQSVRVRVHIFLQGAVSRTCGHPSNRALPVLVPTFRTVLVLSVVGGSFNS